MMAQFTHTYNIIRPQHVENYRWLLNQWQPGVYALNSLSVWKSTHSDHLPMQFIIKDPYKLPITCCKVICCPQLSAWITSISLVTGSEDEAETNLWCPARYDKSGNADDLNDRCSYATVIKHFHSFYINIFIKHLFIKIMFNKDLY